MIHNCEYSVIGEVHSYKFTDYPIHLTLTPACYILPDVNQKLNLLCIDIIRIGEKKHCDAGETICSILLDFINNNRSYSLGYYPMFSDCRDVARSCLFNKWTDSYINTDDVFTIKNILTFPSSEGGDTKNELTFQVFMHNDYPYQSAMLQNLNQVSKSISNK